MPTQDILPNYIINEIYPRSLAGLLLIKLKITMKSAATLGGEINIKGVTFRFYANNKEAKKKILTAVSLKFYLDKWR